MPRHRLFRMRRHLNTAHTVCVCEGSRCTEGECLRNVVPNKQKKHVMLEVKIMFSELAHDWYKFRTETPVDRSRGTVFVRFKTPAGQCRSTVRLKTLADRRRSTYKYFPDDLIALRLSFVTQSISSETIRLTCRDQSSRYQRWIYEPTKLTCACDFSSKMKLKKG